MRILSNQVECKRCGDRPFSANRHDFRNCKCGSIAVDGGMSYLRRVGNLTEFKDISISIPNHAALTAMAEIEEAIKTGRNSLGILCAVARGLRDAGYNIDNSNLKEYKNGD